MNEDLPTEFDVVVIGTGNQNKFNDLKFKFSDENFFF